MLNMTLLISFILVIIALIGAPVLVKLLATGFEGEQFNLAVKLTRIGLPMILFNGVIGVMSGYLQSEGKFNSNCYDWFSPLTSFIFFTLYSYLQFLE